jgi:hypothetical protein
MSGFRLWWSRNADALVLPLVIAGLIVLAGVLFMPIGPTSSTFARVNGFATFETKRGTQLGAKVVVWGHPAVVRLGDGHGCAIGDLIEIERTPKIWGDVVVVGPRACQRWAPA